MQPVRVRFAPSPTGPFHIGGARSALFNWLFARRYGGVFILRIEDTDLERSSRESEENILAALRWLGLDWDEGVEVGGPNGPYRQTERLELYQRYAEQLLSQKDAYRCYCTEEELAAEREALLAEGALSGYSGRCRNLSPEDCARLEAEGRKPAIRFRVPDNQGTIVVRDLVRGEVSFDCSDIGDFIILKSDGIPTYNFAVVVDDHCMSVSHVIRAEEHLPNTPRQILLYNALGWETPQFAHVSLILGKDRSKMSKRHGATAIEQYQEKGYLPEAMVNFLALLGWSAGGEEEIFSLEELTRQFSLERVSKSPAVFDLDKLNWLNGHYIRQSPIEYITDLSIPFLEKAGYLKTPLTPERYEWLKEVIALVRKYLVCLDDLKDHVGIYFNEEVEVLEEEAREALTAPHVPALFEALARLVLDCPALSAEAAKGLLKAAGKEAGVKGKQIFIPVRAALTGSIEGPDLDRIMAILGKERVARRLAAALDRGL
ncbi:MAG TPA: glutamate--tRNA ligase [Bacillota bacterium]|nr:glutamate--tRNA ligase [Peptococcaceae bacterium MAG4]NLW37070.1 glutamate--tRNA ligase [Peptococcaceae bacterium]HPZ44319.1 glutamate--tRNA ligase [Bacillota bacterium]HUM59643.1 glutamate--tRNA ligase [Bacillota bacterium]